MMKAGGLEALSDKLTSCASNPQVKFEDTEGRWILLLIILFQDANFILAPTTMHIILFPALLMKLDEVIDRFFAAQTMVSVAQLCFVLYNIPKIRALSMAPKCIEPLILLMQYENSTTIESDVYAF